MRTFAARLLVSSKYSGILEQLKKRFLDTGLRVPATVYFGVIERLSATALHIGFTLLLAYHPLLILVTLPLHSVVRVGASWSLPRARRKYSTIISGTTCSELWSVGVAAGCLKSAFENAYPRHSNPTDPQFFV